MTAIAIVVGVLAYPVIAGMVYRAGGNPKPCDGRGVPTGYPGWPCDGPGDICAVSHGHSCIACQRVRILTRRAWLWPMTWIPYVGRRLFDAGANVSATPRLPSADSEAPQATEVAR